MVEKQKNKQMEENTIIIKKYDWFMILFGIMMILFGEFLIFFVLHIDFFTLLLVNFVFVVILFGLSVINESLAKPKEYYILKGKRVTREWFE